MRNRPAEYSPKAISSTGHQLNTEATRCADDDVFKAIIEVVDCEVHHGEGDCVSTTFGVHASLARRRVDTLLEPLEDLRHAVNE